MNSIVSFQYVWLLWSSAFLIPWLIFYLAYPDHRRTMLWASLFTTPLGLTEPLFVPEYWNPPSLFDLAQRTGFDLESLIFCFGIGGVSAVLYNIVFGTTPKPVSDHEKVHPRHQYHRWTLAAPFILFAMIVWFPWNPIYPSLVAMFFGVAATLLCRPDLWKKTWFGGLLFLIYYVVFLQMLAVLAPGYIETVWNLERLSGIYVFNMPVEEPLFAIGFGLYWASVYEHYQWLSS